MAGKRPKENTFSPEFDAHEIEDVYGASDKKELHKGIVEGDPCTQE